MQKTICLIFLALVLVFDWISAADAPHFASGRQNPEKFEQTITVSCKYLLFLPKNFYDKQQQWPLILFLHGSGVRGDVLEKIKKTGLPKIVETKKDFPFVMVSPQCPKDKSWPSQGQVLMALLDELVKKYPIDPNRIYLTGLSMGGSGVWKLGCEYPERFAAVVPICGWGDITEACRLKDTPVWAFHGTLDDAVPVEQTTKMVEAIKKCGGNPKVTIYPDVGHDSYKRAYDDPELYKWLLQQSRGNKIGTLSAK